MTIDFKVFPRFSVNDDKSTIKQRKKIGKYENNNVGRRHDYVLSDAEKKISDT